jgi:hypothetical protein
MKLQAVRVSSPKYREMRLHLLVCSFLVCGLSCSTYAQQTDHYLRLMLKDSSVFKGRIVQEEAASFQFYDKTIKRRFNVPRQKVLRVDTLGEWRPATDAFQNILGPANGFNLKKGNFYYQNFLLSINALHYGINDRLSMGAGVDVISSLYSDDGLSFFFLPKYTFPIHEQLHAGLSALWLRLPDSGGFISHQVYFGSVSYGTARDQISAGIGYTVIEGDFIPDPVFTFAAKKKLIGLLSADLECYAGAPVEGLIVLMGIQLSGQRVDFSVALPLGNTDGAFFVSPAPILGLGVKFPAK